MYKGIYRLKPWKDRRLRRLAKWLHKLNCSANLVTCFGLILGLLGAISLGIHQPFLGMVLILSSIFTDLLDGTIARLSNKETISGKLFDAITDRIVESSLVGALIYLGQLPWWGWLLPLGSVLLLIHRCLAFRLYINTSFVLIARFERMAAIIGVIIFPRLWVTHFFYLIIICGTFCSIIMIVREILAKAKENLLPETKMIRGDL